MAMFTPEMIEKLKAMSNADASKAIEEMLTEQAHNAIPTGNVQVFVGPSGMVCFKTSSGTTITMREDMVRRIFSDGKVKLLESGALDFTPGKPLKDHEIVKWLNTNPTTKHEARKAGTFRGRITPARPAFVAKLGVKTEFPDDE